MAIGTNAAIDAEGCENPPPNSIPSVMLSAFTFGGLLPVGSLYFNAEYLGSEAMQPVWTHSGIESMIEHANKRTLEGNYGRQETNWVLEGLW